MLVMCMFDLVFNACMGGGHTVYSMLWYVYSVKVLYFHGILSLLNVYYLSPLCVCPPSAQAHGPGDY